MIQVIALTKEGNLIHDISLEQLKQEDVIWYWADFNMPNEEEIALLDTFFGFHHLAIEDCLHRLQRPKLDYYGKYNFFVLHSLASDTLTVEEIDLFVGENFVVSFHLNELSEIGEARHLLLSGQRDFWEKGHVHVAYLIMDKIVDQYFPVVYKIEDELDDIDNIASGSLSRNLVDQLFDVRADLLKMRRTVNAMRDLLYRILNSTHLASYKSSHVYFTDIYDHLLKLSDMIEANRDMTSDIRDNYLSINSNRMNVIMTLLTVITAIFIPLTFIAGVYGMNFRYMPELEWRYGYFIIWGVMVVIGILMYLWFKKKGWFDFYK